ncbi:unnamed protein product, partial [Rotaria sp. Silwood2]
MLHYNVRYFYSNQADLIDMVNVYYPSIISLNELGTVIPDKIIKQLLFSYNVYTKQGTNPHGGVVLAIDKRLKCELMDVNEPNTIAALVTIERQQFIVASIYSPPTEQLPLTTMSTLLKESKNIIIIGDLNAKHPDWGCPQSVTSPNPTVFWSTVKKLNKKKSVEFSAITEESTIHRSPEDIVKNLAQHFAERHVQAELNMANTLDREANELWQLYNTADKNDIRLISKQSDLQFNEQDIKNTIRSLKNKNSSGFDQMSNKMIKELPAHFHVMLTHAYNDLFRSAHWGSEWKVARAICLNKSDNPVPTTNQLRPISMLPVFKSVLINVERGAPQGSCLGPVMYVISHHDLPQLFANPMNVHAYVDDIAIVYAPSMNLKFKHQVIEIEKNINNDMRNLLNYANDWHQPLNPKKPEIVNYHRAVQSP